MPDTYERDLTPREIEERTARRDKLDDERDDLIAAVAERRKEIRGLNASRRKIELELLDVRREIRSGKVIESRQMPLELAPIGPSLESFDRSYPMALDAEHLHAQLSLVLQGVLVPSIERLGQWHPDTGIFNAVANWARTELAYMNKSDIEKFHPEIVLPPRGTMPVKLAEVRAELQRAIEERSGKRSRKSVAVMSIQGSGAMVLPVPPPRRAAKKARRSSKREARA